MKNYAVIQHTYSEFLGLIEKHLEKRDIGFNYFRPFIGQDFPGSAIHFDALFLLAGAWPIGDQTHCPWLEDEVYIIEIFQKAKRPIVGIGFGGLLIAKYYGGEACLEPMHQAYWTKAHKTEAGQNDAVAEALDGKEVLVMINGDVKLSDNIQPILVDDNGHWLAIRPEPLTYGFLFRPEIKPGMLEDIIMEAEHNPPPNISELLTQARDKWNTMQATTDEFIFALVKELDLMKERHKAPIFHLKVE